jgi:hypothetical protein
LHFFGWFETKYDLLSWNGDYLNSKFELQNLQHRFLVQWGEDGILYVHEQLRDMGQNIAMELPIMS